MISAELNAAARCVRVRWPDGETADFPFLWLRDNCPSDLHPQTRERQFDLLSVTEDIHPVVLGEDDGGIRVTWSEAGHVSRYDGDWLRCHRPGRRAPDPAAIAPAPWRADLDRDAIPRASADALLKDDRALLEWLIAGKRLGIALVDGLDDGLDDRAEAGMEVARRIGFLRETNFGTTFEVVSKPDPNNLAYTAEALPLHTDLTNQELPPGFQFLHCIVNGATGGGSMFCDGFAVAEELRACDPEAFALLSDVEIPMRFHDGAVDIRRHDTVIETNRAGDLVQLRFNAHLAGIFDMPVGQMADYYRAYRRLMALTRHPDYAVALRLAAGEMVVFDNRRVLHGRQAFDPSTGRRHLRGAYVDRGEWDSRIRVLSRA